MKKIKFGISMIPFLLAGSIAANAGVTAYENRPREFEEITDSTNIDRISYKKYEEVSYKEFKELLKKDYAKFLMEYEIVETGEEDRILLDSDYILNQRDYLSYISFNRQSKSLYEAIENGEIKIKSIHYVHHISVDGDDLKNFNIKNEYLEENLNDNFHITTKGKNKIEGNIIFIKNPTGDIEAVCYYRVNYKNLLGKKYNTKLKECSETIPASENKDQCKYDDTSILSQESVIRPSGELKYLDTTEMTYDEIKNISSKFYIIDIEKEISKEELLQLLEEKNMRNIYIRLEFVYKSYPYKPLQYRTTKQDYINGNDKELKSILENPNIKNLKIKFYSRETVKEIPEENELENCKITIVREHFYLVCMPIEKTSTYCTMIYSRDSMNKKKISEEVSAIQIKKRNKQKIIRR